MAQKKITKAKKKKAAKKSDTLKLNMGFEDAIALSIKTKMPKK
jgi:hypothetical protein